MRDYIVTLETKQILYARVHVTAESEDQAKELALAEQDDCEWKSDDLFYPTTVSEVEVSPPDYESDGKE